MFRFLVARAFVQIIIILTSLGSDIFKTIVYYIFLNQNTHKIHYVKNVHDIKHFKFNLGLRLLRSILLQLLTLICLYLQLFTKIF